MRIHFPKSSIVLVAILLFIGLLASCTPKVQTPANKPVPVETQEQLTEETVQTQEPQEVVTEEVVVVATEMPSATEVAVTHLMTPGELPEERENHAGDYSSADTANFAYAFKVIGARYIEDSDEFGKKLSPYPGGREMLPKLMSYGKPVYYYDLGMGSINQRKIGTYPIIDASDETLAVKVNRYPTADLSADANWRKD